MHWTDLVGMAGVTLVLVAYFLLQSGRMPATAPAYSWLNIAGSGAILVSLTHAFNLSSFVIQVAWIAISGWGLWRAGSRRNAASEEAHDRDSTPVRQRQGGRTR